MAHTSLLAGLLLVFRIRIGIREHGHVRSARQRANVSSPNAGYPFASTEGCLAVGIGLWSTLIKVVAVRDTPSLGSIFWFFFSFLPCMIWVMFVGH